MTHNKGGGTESDGAHPELQHGAKCESSTECLLHSSHSKLLLLLIWRILKEVQSITKDKVMLSLTPKLTDKVPFARQ